VLPKQFIYSAEAAVIGIFFSELLSLRHPIIVAR
jgi:hypothetical protein